MKCQFKWDLWAKFVVMSTEHMSDVSMIRQDDVNSDDEES